MRLLLNCRAPRGACQFDDSLMGGSPMSVNNLINSIWSIGCYRRVTPLTGRFAHQPFTRCDTRCCKCESSPVSTGPGSLSSDEWSAAAEDSVRRRGEIGNRFLPKIEFYLVRSHEIE